MQDVSQVMPFTLHVERALFLDQTIRRVQSRTECKINFVHNLQRHSLQVHN